MRRGGSPKGYQGTVSGRSPPCPGEDNNVYCKSDVFAIPKLLFVRFGFLFLGYSMLGSSFMPNIGERYKHQFGTPRPCTGLLEKAATAESATLEHQALASHRSGAAPTPTAPQTA